MAIDRGREVRAAAGMVSGRPLPRFSRKEAEMTIAIVLDKAGAGPVGSKQPGRLFVGSEKVRRGVLNVGSYLTNGVPVVPALFELRSVRRLDLGLLSLDGTTVFVWDAANGKVKAFSALGTEVVNGTNLTSKTVRFEAAGT